MNILNNNFSSIESMREQFMQKSPKKPDMTNIAGEAVSFREILQKKQDVEQSCDTLKFSKHANERLASRKIDLSKEQVERLERGTNLAREKGICETLVMVDNLAFIVNVKNSTVITAVSGTEDTVFTNIDGAVIS